MAPNQYICSYCNKAFSKRTYLLTHSVVHTGSKPYQCSYCDKSFSQNCYFKMHIETHTGNKPYQCSLCDKAFSLNSNLQMHIKTHTGKKPYQCNLCDKSFSQNFNLKMHIKTHSGNKLNSNLQMHIKTHTGKKFLDAIAQNDLQNAGQRIILPPTIYGTPRFYQECFYDAMALVLHFGKPDYFITITTNPNWLEIIECPWQS